MTQLPEHLDDVGPGWSQILLDLHGALVKLDPDYDVAQVKEKFGGLRVYIDGDWNDDVEAAILAAGDRANATCEACGKPGKLRDDRSWLKTLCDEHAASRTV